MLRQWTQKWNQRTKGIKSITKVVVNTHQSLKWIINSVNGVGQQRT